MSTYPLSISLRNEKLLLCKGEKLLLAPERPKWTKWSLLDQIGMSAFLTATKRDWVGLARNSPPLLILSGGQTDMIKCLDQDPSLGQIRTRVELRYKLFSLRFGCQWWISPKIQWLHEPFAILAGDLVEIVQLCAGKTGPFLKWEYRKHFLEV